MFPPIAQASRRIRTSRPNRKLRSGNFLFGFPVRKLPKKSGPEFHRNIDVIAALSAVVTLSSVELDSPA